MKKKIILLLTGITLMFGNMSCTKQERVRAFGGTETIQVEPGKRVMMATWKESDLFYMVEDMPEDYVPHDKTLIESSSYGIWEAKIVFKESR